MAKKPASEEKDIPNGEDVVGTGNDARLKMLEQINDANDKALVDEGALADINDDDTTTALNTAAEEANEEEEVQETEPITEEEPARIKIKVNGKEEELTMEELVERAQKAEGAEEKFKEAARLRAEAEELRKKNIEQPSPDVANEALEKRRARLRAIQMGEEKEGLKALEELENIGKSSAPSFSEDEFMNKVQAYLSFNEAVNRFKTEYNDLISDPFLLEIVQTRDKELLAQGDKRSYWERYESIGNDVRKWMAEKTKTTPAQTTQVKDKQQRKASAPTAPQGASQKAPEAVAEEDQEIPTSEVIAAMAKARGGPQFMR